MKLLNTLFTLLLVLAPVLVSAETVVRTGDAISVDSDQAVEGDYYVSVGPVGNTSMSGSVLGDMYAVGGSVTVNGVVEEDLSIISGVSQIHASVTDDVRIVSGEVVVAEDIGGDLFVVAGTLKILSSAKVDGNVYFFGGDGVIEGTVSGSVFGTASRLRIDGSVGGNVDVKTYDQLTLGSKTSVVGDVRYTSESPVLRAPEAVVEGKLQQHSEEVPDSRDKIRTLLVPLFITLFAALSMYLLFRRELTAMVAIRSDRYPTHILLGLAVLVLAPVISVMLMVTVLGFLVGVVAAALTVILLVTGYIISGIVCGAYIAKWFKQSTTVSLIWVVVGTALLQSIVFVPVIGPITLLLVYTFSVGLLTHNLYRLLQ